MIEFAKSYKASDGKCYGTLVEAQIVELSAIFLKRMDAHCKDRTIPFEPGAIAAIVLEQKEAIIDILTTTDTSRPRARRVNGGSKKRKPAPTVAPAQPQAA